MNIIPTGNKGLDSLHNTYDSMPWDKPSHLHQFKEIPDPQGNRAQRRAWKKKYGKTSKDAKKV